MTRCFGALLAPQRKRANNFALEKSSEGKMPSLVMKRGNHISRLRFVGFMAALASVLFVATGASLLHVDAPGASESTCPICHVSHAPMVPALWAVLQGAHSFVERLLLGDEITVPVSVVSIPLSRAPPNSKS
jgi:hypothetical protein